MTHWTKEMLQQHEDKLARKGIILHDQKPEKKPIDFSKFPNNIYRINIKPLSVNHGYTGKRWKTPAHRMWHKAVMQMLPLMDIPSPPYCLHLIFGFSSERSDGDNHIKFIQDCLAKKYGFNDKKIKRWIIDVEKTNTNEEYFCFKIETKH